MDPRSERAARLVVEEGQEAEEAVWGVMEQSRALEAMDDLLRDAVPFLKSGDPPSGIEDTVKGALRRLEDTASMRIDRGDQETIRNIRRAVEDGQWEMAAREIEVLARSLNIRESKIDEQSGPLAGWLKTFLSEKGISLEEPIEVEGPSGTNFMTIENVVDQMVRAPRGEQERIKKKLVRADFNNAPNSEIVGFIKTLAQAIAR